MLMTIIERWTSWPEAFSLSTAGDAASAQACAKLFESGYLVLEFHSPQICEFHFVG